MTTGSPAYFRVEGCNFGRTIDDTSDLSTIRGASLAYIDAPHMLATALGLRLGVEFLPIIEAASIGYYRVGGDASPEDIEQAAAELLAEGWEDVGAGEAGADDVVTNERDFSALRSVLPHLTFTYAAGRLGDGASSSYLQLSRLIAAKARWRQFTQPTVDLPALSAAAGKPCGIDGMRPESGEIVRRGPRRIAVSASVSARRAYGIRMKQAFYRREAGYVGDSGAEFARSFEDLVEPHPPTLKPQLRNKIAVVYLDGNAFGKLREAVVRQAQKASGNDFGEAEVVDGRLSRFLRDKRRDLLTTLLNMAAGDPRMTVERKDGGSLLRFETLLWGGDESMIVIPGWKTFDTLAVLADAFGQGWTYGSVEPGTDSPEFRLTHATGVAIGNVGTPIRYLKRLAKDLAEEAKQAVKKPEDPAPWSAGNACQIAILESVEPPLNGVETFCHEFYGAWDRRAFTMLLDREIQKFNHAMAAITDTQGGLPRSQLFNILGEGAKLRGSEGVIDPAGARDLVDGYAVQQMQRARTSAEVQEVFRGAGHGLGDGQVVPLLPFQRCAEFWDYFSPFAQHSKAG